LGGEAAHFFMCAVSYEKKKRKTFPNSRSAPQIIMLERVANVKTSETQRMSAVKSSLLHAPLSTENLAHFIYILASETNSQSYRFLLLIKISQ